MNDAPRNGRPIIFGEVLFDCFPDGSRVVGGAPFNVAWHLQGFGLAPLLISRVGNDALGERILAAMGEWGMARDGVQRDAEHPTGSVAISLGSGQHRFEILADQAYDYIEETSALAIAASTEVALFYHGTLAARNTVSAATLSRLRRAVHAPRIVDVNLRAPWWRSETACRMLESAAWAKLNDEELAQLTGQAPAVERLESAATALRGTLGIETLVVTLGAEGAALLSDAGWQRFRAKPAEAVVDTVGAGDAFSAVVILGLLRRWPQRQIIERAAEFAAGVCGLRGATIGDRAFYGHYLAKWGA